MIRSILAVTLLFAALTGTFATSHKPVCYITSVKCCYKYALCGAKVHKVKFVKPCPFKKCGIKKCKLVCKIVRGKKRVTVCKKVKVPAGKPTCKKVRVWTPKGDIWRKICKTDFVTKRVCKSKFVRTKKRVCKKVCGTVCKKIKAVCIKYGIYKAPKWCPKKICWAPKTFGSTRKPKDIVGPKKFVKFTKVVRKW